MDNSKDIPNINFKPEQDLCRQCGQDANRVLSISNNSINSAELLCNRDKVYIMHKGEQYILRVTASGKLILNK